VIMVALGTLVERDGRPLSPSPFFLFRGLLQPGLSKLIVPMCRL
jgi:hypothetical protein